MKNKKKQWVIKWYTRKHQYNIKKAIMRNKGKRDIHIEKKQQNGRHKSYLITNYTVFKQTQYFNQKAEIGKMDF